MALASRYLLELKHIGISFDTIGLRFDTGFYFEVPPFTFSNITFDWLKS